MPEPTYDVRLLPGADAVLDAVARGSLTEPGPYRLQLQAERLLLVAGFDELICLDTLDFVPFGYQVKAAQTALRRFRGRGLLCDEVGLGKTIEAGLALKEYLLRQLAHRALILTPPALVEQWREELAYKFRLDDFVTSSDPEFRDLGPQAWATFPHVIASLATARRAWRLAFHWASSWRRWRRCRFSNGCCRDTLFLHCQSAVQDVRKRYDFIKLLEDRKQKSLESVARLFLIELQVAINLWAIS